MTSNEFHIISNPISAQYEAVLSQSVVGLLSYDRAGAHLDLRHTFVPEAFRGQGVARVLVAEALEMIRKDGCTVSASCSYVNAFIEQHPSFKDLLTEKPKWANLILTGTPSTRSHAATMDSHPDTITVYPDTVTTARLTLRPWAGDDADEAFRIYGDPKVMKWTEPFISQVGDHDQMRRRLDAWVTQSNHLPRPQGRWAIELNESSTVVGGAHLLETRGSVEPRLVMSWELAPLANGRGFATEVGHALAHSAFSVDPTLSAVYALAHPGNASAVATLGRIGMRALPWREHHHGAELAVFSISRQDLHHRG